MEQTDNIAKRLTAKESVSNSTFSIENHLPGLEKTNKGVSANL